MFKSNRVCRMLVLASLLILAQGAQAVVFEDVDAQMSFSQIGGAIITNRGDGTELWRTRVRFENLGLESLFGVNVLIRTLRTSIPDEGLQFLRWDGASQLWQGPDRTASAANNDAFVAYEETDLLPPSVSGIDLDEPVPAYLIGDMDPGEVINHELNLILNEETTGAWFNIDIVARRVDEPTVALLLSWGLLGLAFTHRRRRM